MKLLRAFDRGLTAVLDGVLVAAFAVMLLLAALQVFLRFFFNSGIVWGDVASRHLVIWVGFFGAYLAARGEKHFQIDALVRLFPERLRLWCKVLTDLFAVAVCFYLVKAALTFVSVGIDPETVVFLGIREKFLASIVPVGFGLVGIQFLLRAIESFASAVRGGESR